MTGLSFEYLIRQDDFAAMNPALIACTLLKASRQTISLRLILLTALLLAPLAVLHAADASASGRSFRPVELMHPREGWELTDVSAAFRWKTQCDEKSGWHVVTYQLQVANEPGFERPFWDRGIEAPHGVTEKNYWYWRQFSWQPEEFLPAGNWFWRVRVADEAGGPWSEPAGFRVNAEHKLTAPVRELSAKHPLFVFNMYRLEKDADISWASYWNFFPDGLKPFVAFQINRWGVGAPDNDIDFTALVRRATDAGAQVLIGTGGPDRPVSTYADLAEIEWLFQHCPNVLGVVIAETFWAYGERERQETPYYQRLLQLCAKYGRYCIQGDGNWGRFNWDRLFAGAGRLDSATLRRCAPYFVPCAKTNVRDSYFEAEGAVLGGWLAGLAGNQGRWCEAWYWSDVGFADPFAPPQSEGDLRKMPPIFWNQKFITGIASGASVLVFGGESSVTEVGVYDAATDRFTGHAGVGADYTAVWDGRGHKTPVLDRYVIPFLRAAVTQKLIPDKTEVLQSTRLAVVPGAPGEDRGLTTDYGRYAPLYRATYGMRDYVSLNPSTNPCAFSLPLDGATGRFVRIEKAGLWEGAIQLALAEVSVNSDGRNIAPTGVATQSSVLFGGEARRAIDGNTDGRWQSGSVSTTKEEPKPWWELDLGSPRPLQSIQVFARNERGNYGRADIHSGSGWRVSLLDDQRRVVWSGAPVEKPGTRSSLGAEYEVLPNNGRYHFIPVLPHGVSPLSGIASVRLNELDTEAAVKTRFDPAYPDRSTGGAWVCEAGERVFVMNNHENCNDAQDYAVGFADGRLLRRLSGTALPHWYLMGRWTDHGRQFWFQANANHKGPYTDGRQTRVVLECENELSVITSPPQALVSRTWNGPRNELTLLLSHNQGAVEVTLHSP